MRTGTKYEHNERETIETSIRELHPMYVAQKSFGRKAYTKECNIVKNGAVDYVDGGYKTRALVSYGTEVLNAYKDGSTAYFGEIWRNGGRKWANMSATSRRHIVEYWLQHMGAYYYTRPGGRYEAIEAPWHEQQILIGAGYDFIGICGTVDGWAKIWAWVDYMATGSEYKLGGKAWKAWKRTQEQALEAGVPVEDIIA